jgi:hypothetical protein
VKLLVEELISEISQEFQLIGGKIFHANGIRPYLYAHNNPLGTFTFTLLSGVNELSSVSFTSSQLYSALQTSDDFIHLVYDLEFPHVLPLKNGVYKLKLTASGYTFNPDCFLGWVKEHEDLKFPVSTIPTSDDQNPLTFELWEFE